MIKDHQNSFDNDTINVTEVYKRSIHLIVKFQFRPFQCLLLANRYMFYVEA